MGSQNPVERAFQEEEGVKHLKRSKRPSKTRARLTVGFVEGRLVTLTLREKVSSVRVGAGVEIGPKRQDCKGTYGDFFVDIATVSRL